MTSRAMLAAALLALTQAVPSQPVSAQGAAPGSASLNAQQREGWLLTLQYCALCHTRTNLHSTTTIGPILSRDSGGGREDVMREVISNGTPRMPGFKHHFEPPQIDAIVAYLKTIPALTALPVIKEKTPCGSRHRFDLAVSAFVVALLVCSGSGLRGRCHVERHD